MKWKFSLADGLDYLYILYRKKNQNPWGNYKHWSYQRMQGSDGELKSKIWGHLDLNSISSPLKSCTLSYPSVLQDLVNIIAFAYLKFLQCRGSFQFYLPELSRGFNSHPSWWPGLFELGGFCLCFLCVFVCLTCIQVPCVRLQGYTAFTKGRCARQRNFCPGACQPVLRHEQWHRTIAAWPTGIASGVLRGADVVFRFLCLFVWTRLSVFNRGGGAGSWDAAFHWMLKLSGIGGCKGDSRKRRIQSKILKSRRPK